MGIGTSDGRYYPNEMEQTLHELTVDTDPLPPNTKYDDSPTDLQNARDGSIYNNLKQNEGEMEKNLKDYSPEAPADRPVTPVQSKENGGWGPRPKDLPDNIEWAPTMDKVREWHSDPDAEAIDYTDRSELKKLVPEGYEGYVTEMSDGKKYLLRRPVKSSKPPLVG